MPTSQRKSRHRLATAASWKNGEAGIRFARFPQPPASRSDALQPIDGVRFTLHWLVRVICGCLVSVGIVFSTVSARIPDRRTLSPPTLPPRAAGWSRPCCSRRTRRGHTDGDDGPKIAASYARYSSELQDEKSIADQQRMCREQAVREGLVIGPDFEFADNAVSGTKLRRAGLDQLLDVAKQRGIQVLYFHSLSRLARESVI